MVTLWQSCWVGASAAPPEQVFVSSGTSFKCLFQSRDRTSEIISYVYLFELNLGIISNPVPKWNKKWNMNCIWNQLSQNKMKSKLSRNSYPRDWQVITGMWYLYFLKEQSNYIYNVVHDSLYTSAVDRKWMCRRKWPHCLLFSFRKRCDFCLAMRCCCWAIWASDMAACSFCR